MALQINRKKSVIVSVAMVFVTAISGIAISLFGDFRKGLTANAAQATYIVTTTADTGPGSLRQAITDANANSTTPGTPHLIQFNIPGSGLQTISLSTALPQIIQPTTIDGTTQSGSVCGDLVPQNPDGTIKLTNIQHSLNIEVTSSQISAGAAVFNIGLAAAGSSLKGMVINGSQTSTFYNVMINAPDVTVECNYIGTNAAGDSSVSRAGAGGIRAASTANNVLIENNLVSGNGRYGLDIKSGQDARIYNNLIGTERTGTSALPNSSSDGAQGSGIYIFSTDSADIYKNVISGHKEGIGGGGGNYNTHLFIRGNYIGTDITGMGALPNDNGIMLSVEFSRLGGLSADDRNVISSNRVNNVRLNSARDTVIRGNYIGVGSDGRANLGKSGVSLYMGYDADRIQIGGSQSGEGNIIANATSYGMTTEGSGVTDVTVQGNYFGTNPQGDDAGNGWRSVLLRSPGVKFGGNQPGEGNVVGFTTIGLRVERAATVVQGNYIGVLPDGITPVGNTYIGIEITSSDFELGGTSSGEKNTIAKNSIGVRVLGSRDTISGNSIYSNSHAGIDLGVDGLTTNDPEDTDTGPNGHQNYPEIRRLVGCDNAAQGSFSLFNSTANTTFIIDYYSNPSWTPEQILQGEQWIGSETVTTDADGDASFIVPGAAVNVSMTATSPDGSTSELGGGAPMRFSACQDMIPRRVPDSTNSVSLQASWSGMNIPQSYYRSVYDNDSGTYVPKKVGLEASITVGGKPFIFQQPESPGDYFSAYGIDSSLWYSQGHIAEHLPEGSYDVVLKISDPLTGMVVTKTYVDSYIVELPKIIYTTTITNNQTPSIQGRVTGVQGISTAYILPKGQTLDLDTAKQRILNWDQDADTEDSEATSGTWKIITNKEDHITSVTQAHVTYIAQLPRQLVEGYFSDLEGVDPSAIVTIEDMKDLCISEDVSQRVSDLWSVPNTEQVCRDQMQQFHDHLVASENERLQDYMEALNAPDSPYDFTPLDEGVYDIYLMGRNVDYNEFSHSILEGLVVDITKPTASLVTHQANTSPALNGVVDDPSATVTVTINNKTYTAMNNGDGTWTLGAGVIDPLSPGEYTVTVTVTDFAGNSTISTHVLGISAVELEDASDPDSIENRELSMTGTSIVAAVLVAVTVALAGAAVIVKQRLARNKIGFRVY